jgi:hypothetical protein
MRKLTAATAAVVATLSLGVGTAVASSAHPNHAKTEITSSHDRKSDRISNERSSRDRRSGNEVNSSRDRASADHSDR